MRVVPDVPAIHRRFDYAVPAGWSDPVTVGSRVRIDLHGRRVGAWVVEDHAAPPAGVEPKPLSASSGLGPPPALVALAEWAAWRWAGPISSFLGTASPPRVVRAPLAGRARRAGGVGTPPPSPGGGSVDLVDRALAGGGPAVIRLAPALDAGLVALELLHRVGAGGVLVLAPTRHRAEQIAGRLRLAGVPVALLPDGWEAASSGGSVAVGARAAAWAPLPHLTAALVLDAHDDAYREERAPTWSAVDVVLERARRERTPAILVSPCPPVTMTEGLPLVTTDRSVERRGWPLVEVVDRSADDPRTGLFSDRMVRAAREVLARPDGRVVCILNRTGRVRVLACASCGALARCTICGGAVAQPEAGGPLVCGRCANERPALCAACDSARLKNLRIGVARASEELGALLGTEATEVSASTPPGPLVAPLVVGTEAALHRVVAADLVVFLDIDQHLLAHRFAAAEETLALLARAARLVGGREGTGRLLVQTRIPGHEVLVAAVRADPSLAADAERTVRLELGLPPFGALALLKGPGAPAYAEALGSRDGLAVSAGGSADRWVARAGDHTTLCDGLAATERPAERLRVEVDPTDA